MMNSETRLICILIGIFILAIASYLVRRRRLYNIYAITWFSASVIFISMGAFPSFFENLASLLGAHFTPVAILVVAIMGLGAIVLHLSVIATEQRRQIRHFEKETAMARRQLPGDNCLAHARKEAGADK